jgi:hypothetical protein
MRTSQDVTISFRDYGNITVPKGTRLTHNTALGADRNYHFVDDFSWIKKNYPQIDRFLYHDAYYYGIDIPKEFVEYD